MESSLIERFWIYELVFVAYLDSAASFISAAFS